MWTERILALKPDPDYENVDIELGHVNVFLGPNNSENAPDREVVAARSHKGFLFAVHCLLNAGAIRTAAP
jgi:hypothetical protein